MKTLRRHTKKTSLVIALALISFSSNNAHSTGIPVVDVAHIAETSIAYLQMMEDYRLMYEQYTNMIERLELLKETRGITDIGVEIGNILSQNRVEVLPKDLPTIKFQEPSFSIDDLFSSDENTNKAKETYTKRNEFIYSSIETVNEMYAALHQRKTNLESLNNQISLAVTNKQILDLTARIAAESALLQNDIAMIGLLNISIGLSKDALEHDENGRLISNLSKTIDGG